ncbi:MAG: SRPBCC family protein [Alphaproteobacteria bacterium]|nr:SRPBCC family protein [Alphaproteobacteria bacterium]
MSSFVYVTYIRTTPEKLWAALISAEFQKQYWFGMYQECDWKEGSPWKMCFPDGRVADAGEVLEVDPPRRLVLKWRNEFRPEMKAEGHSRCVYELEQAGDAVKFTVTHTIDRTPSKFIEAVSGGWPKVLAGLKSYLETDIPLKGIHETCQARE